MSCCTVSNQQNEAKEKAMVSIDKLRVNKHPSKAQCQQCGQEAKQVQKITVVHMLKNDALKKLTGERFYYCENPDCEVVYFSDLPEIVYKKDNIRIKIGVKEQAGPQAYLLLF